MCKTDFCASWRGFVGCRVAILRYALCRGFRTVQVGWLGCDGRSARLSYRWCLIMVDIGNMVNVDIAVGMVLMINACVEQGAGI